MAPELKKESKRYPLALGVSVLVVAALGVLVYVLRGASEEATGDLARAKRNYVRMKEMARTLRDLRRKNPDPFLRKEEAGDVLRFLSSKAREAEIPDGVLSIGPSPSVKVGAWKETPYTVNLRSVSKDAPLSRVPLATFLRLVEEQRTLLRSKNANLSFSGNDLKSAIIVFSQFALEEEKKRKE